jgi:hypothetical protein
MADPGLLKSLPVVCMALLLQTGCQHYAPRVAGRVVDAESGVGIEGVEVFRSVTVIDRLAILIGKATYDFSGEGRSWATTASDGSFEIPATPLAVGRLRARMEPEAFLTWVHREYGWGYLNVRKADFGHVEIRVERDPEKLDFMAHHYPKASRGPCSFREAEPSDHCCEIAFGWSDGCK